MRYEEITEATRTLGGFTVTVVGKVPGGEKHDGEMDEAYQYDESNLWYRYDTSDGRVKQRMIQNLEEREAYRAGYRDSIDAALRVANIIRSKFDPKKFVQKQGGKWVEVHPFGTPNAKSESPNEDATDELDSNGKGIASPIGNGRNKPTVDEAIKIDSPQKQWSRDELQGYADRIKTGTQTKQDKFKPIIHGSNIKAITKDDGGTEWDLDDLARQIMVRPTKILGTNAKMAKSKKEGAITYDLTLPALSGIVVDEETGEFVEITTCPGAGECQLFCYARKGGYRMFPASSMSAAQSLNFLVNDPSGYMAMFDKEVKAVKKQADKNGIKLLVRVHDAGDFFSKEYYDLVMNVKQQNPGVRFYFYTKMGDIASADQPDDVVAQFSGGAKRGEQKKVEFVRGVGKHVKDAITLPKDMFRGLFQTDAKGKYIKDAEGRTQVKSEADWQQFRQKLASAYHIDPKTIITYDQMVKIPEGPTPKWNVVIFPAGHGDLGASRLDVANQFMMFH